MNLILQNQFISLHLHCPKANWEVQYEACLQSDSKAAEFLVPQTTNATTGPGPIPRSHTHHAAFCVWGRDLRALRGLHCGTMGRSLRGGEPRRGCVYLGIPGMDHLPRCPANTYVTCFPFPPLLRNTFPFCAFVRLPVSAKSVGFVCPYGKPMFA